MKPKARWRELASGLKRTVEAEKEAPRNLANAFGFVRTSCGMTPREQGRMMTAGTEAQFGETHWSLVLAAANPQSGRAQAALETLCRTYWYPLYAFLRRQGRTPEEAKDLTQEFFVHLFEKQTLARARQERGKFAEVRELFTVLQS